MSGIWDGECLVAGRMYLFRGKILRAVTMQAPLLQLVAPIQPQPLNPPFNEVTAHPLLLGANTPVILPEGVAPSNVLVIDCASTLARRLAAMQFNGTLPAVSANAFDAAAVQAFATQSLRPMLTLIQTACAWEDALESLTRRSSTHPRLQRVFDGFESGHLYASTTEAARAASLSLGRFCAAFKSDVGMTFNDYLAAQRFLYILNKLALGASSLAAVSNQAGLFDLPHLSRSLRRFIDAKPGDLLGMRPRLSAPF
ncbi:MAG: helix-turn-helix domain-containing protein [Burkholderiaceae bacterium]